MKKKILENLEFGLCCLMGWTICMADLIGTGVKYASVRLHKMLGDNMIYVHML